ncbi:iron complex outermembrane recepter protein [Microbulbifer donghaiensis]|uniref:Iron complex outermembrane recepter protein n=1 Tax=Microbulbifer donghaiensis TaxID=494016 RepID=A0A1M4XMF2_9GAMM|nr:TonB-dependent receptor [Microbulbifer donghaiensis]SHE94669.1 iron complex outermembrane recepter protein [Microbulbifer donghaiensis]
MSNNNNVVPGFRKKILPLAVAGLSSMSWVAAPQVFAQQSAQAMEEVVVSARRREESLQEVPQAVSALSGEEMLIAGVSDLADLQSQAPGLTVYPARATSSTVTAYIRGVGQSDPLWGVEPGVGIYVDDVYLARPQGALLEMLDVERVEILRGPQGSLYGRNTIGGAIKYVSRPIAEETEISLQAALGSYNQRDFKAAVSTPLTENLYASLAVGSFERDGFGENRLTGAAVSDKQLYAGRAAIEWRPSERWTVNLAHDVVYDRSAVPGAQRMVPNVIESFFSGAAPLPVSDDRYDVDNGFANQNNDTDNSGTALTISWEGEGNWGFKSITARREGEFNQAIDFDGGPYPIADVDGVQYDEQLSQEFQWQYSGERLDGVFGLYLLDASAGGVVRNRFGLPTALVAPGLESILGPTLAIYGASGGEVETDAAALFGDLSYSLTEATSLSLGGRFNREKKQALVLNQSMADEDFTIPTGQVTADFEGSESWTDFSPRIGLDHQLNDSTLVYASYSEGFKSGGFNIRANTVQVPDSQNPYKPERVSSYELGIKADLSETLRVNAAAFYSDYEDIQLSIFTGVDTTGDGNNDSFFGDFTNAGAGVIRGVELEYQWAPSEFFALSGNATWLDAYYKEYISGGVNVADEQEFTNTPELTYTVNGDFSFPLAELGRLDARLSYNYRDDVYPTTDLSDIVFQEGYGLWNAALVFTPPAESWRLALEGRNLTDEEYRNTGYDLRGSGFPIVSGYYGDPRVWALRLNLDL